MPIDNVWLLVGFRGGASVNTSGEITCVYVSQTKMNKIEEIIAKITAELEIGKGLAFKQL